MVDIHAMLLLSLISLTFTLTQQKSLFPDEDWTSGRIPLRDGDNMFYIHFRARNGNRSAPLMLYLAGGPGSAGQYDIILENGPYISDTAGHIIYNKYSWNNEADTIYVDQPVGVGFSKVRSDDRVCRSRECVVQNMYTFLAKLMETEPELRGRPLYISGVSYGGHYVPAISEYIIRHGSEIVNFRGAFMGSPWVDAQVQFGLDPYYLYERRIYTLWQYVYYTAATVVCRVLIAVSSTTRAYQFCSDMNDEKDEAAGLLNPMNIEEKRGYNEEYEAVWRMFNDRATQRELGVCCMDYMPGNMTAGAELRKFDWLIPYHPHVAFLLRAGYPVTMFYGDLDYTCQYLGGLKVAESMEWEGKEGFENASWEKAKLEEKTYAMRKRYGKLEFYRVFKAGHLVPKDQPRFALWLLQEFIKNNP